MDTVARIKCHNANFRSGNASKWGNRQRKVINTFNFVNNEKVDIPEQARLCREKKDKDLMWYRDFLKRRGTICL